VASVFTPRTPQENTPRFGNSHPSSE
jgi:hypothetical protein